MRLKLSARQLLGWAGVPPHPGEPAGRMGGEAGGRAGPPGGHRAQAPSLEGTPAEVSWGQPGLGGG